MNETSVTTSESTRAFRTARDLLLAHREDLDTACSEFSPPVLDTFNWAADWFDALATEQPTVTALHLVTAGGPEGLTDTKLTYAELSERSHQVAGWLWEQGVRSGDRVLLVLGNVVALWELMLACIRLGAVLIPATTLLSRADLADRVERGQARVVVAATVDTPTFGTVADECLKVAVDLSDGHGEAEGWLPYALTYEHATLAEVAGESAPVTRADDPLLLYFTSGTTAQPKLVAHTHASYPVGHLSTMYWIGLQPGDVHLNISSSGWAKHAWSCFFAPFNAGATALVLGLPRFDAQSLLTVLATRGVTTFCAPPTVWRMLVQQDLTAWNPPVRELLAAGEPLNAEVIEQVRAAWGSTVRDGFGQTETTAQVGNAPGQPVKAGSMGRPLPGYSIVLVDPVTGEIGDDGEICVEMSPRPVGVMTGYAGDTDLSSEAMRGGVYHTGDVASRDRDGYLTYVGRSDDVFKASDYRISPFELESVLVEHPAVAEAAVVPSPDPVRAAVPKAFVTLASGHEPTRETALDIMRHTRENLAAYKRVRLLEFVGGDGLPKTISGKIRRVELRDAQAQRGPGGAGEWADEDLLG
ncbi:MAG: AMP-binding protein [Nocardioidaceae bacterium]|nr:AMP-binding protein [Nocardioidaceae bacterium]